MAEQVHLPLHPRPPPFPSLLLPTAGLPLPAYEEWPRPTVQTKVPADKVNAMDLDHVMSPATSENQASNNSFSMDDLEVAKALTGLRASSPSYQPMMASPTSSATQTSPSSPSRPEPLLSLLTSQHPLVASAINNSLSAYASGKSYSPRFRYGAEFVERNIASPVASTVGTAGRISGVETGVRWWLQRTDSNGGSSRPEAGPDHGHKRRRLDPGMDVERTLPPIDATSHYPPTDPDALLAQPEFLPAYDNNRSPVYQHRDPHPRHPDAAPHGPGRGSANGNGSGTWHTRLMLSTSGLGVAMSEESLRSLRYCFSWLRWANTHLGKVLISLQNVLAEYDRRQGGDRACADGSDDGDGDGGQTATTARPPPLDEATLTKHIEVLKSECLNTLKNALDVVSRYAGGALPENARVLVRRHLTSLPQRFRLASSSSAPSSASHSRTGSSSSSSDRAPNRSGGTRDEEARRRRERELVTGAQRVVVLAREGLDMMGQVSAVVDGTIVSAEVWCERLGRRRRNGEEREIKEKEGWAGEEEAPGGRRCP